MSCGNTGWCIARCNSHLPEALVVHHRLALALFLVDVTEGPGVGAEQSLLVEH